jgi:hypothetical protein
MNLLWFIAVHRLVLLGLLRDFISSLGDLRDDLELSRTGLSPSSE